MIRLLITFVCVATFFNGNAQSSNVFLERSYWKAKPGIEKVRADIKAGNDASEFNAYKFDAVTWAIIEDASNETVWLLLQQKGNDVNKRSHDGRTAIFWASYRGNVELMKQLIDKGGKTDLIDDHGYSLVNFAATTGQVDKSLYELCVKHGADLKSERNKDGANPLLLLMPHLKDTEMIDYFAEHGLSLDQKDDQGNNAFVYAARAGNTKMMELTMSKGLDVHANNDAAMIFASKGMRRKPNGHETFVFLKNQGVSPKAKDKKGKNALHYLASSSKDKEVFDFFFSKALSLDDKDEKGLTPFLIAVERNSAEMISWFIPKVSEKNASNEKGENALHVAAKRGDDKIVEALVNAGVDKDHANKDGLTPLHVAAMTAKDVKVLERLVRLGADKSKETPFGESAYDLAMENELLQKSEASLNFLK